MKKYLVTRVFNKGFWIFGILLLLAGMVFAQKDGKNPQIISEFGKTCSEDVMNRFDNFINTIETTPDSTGYIIFYGEDSAEGKNLLFIKYLTQSYPRKKNFDSSRFKLIRGKNQKRLKIQFWIAPPGARSPKPSEEFSAPGLSRTRRFDIARADFHKSFGELKIYDDGFFDLGCNFPPNLSEFSKILRANKNLQGYLVIYNSDRGRANKILNYAKNGLVKNYNVSQNRIKTIYGGKAKDSKMEFWLVPEGKRPPAFSSR